MIFMYRAQKILIRFQYTHMFCVIIFIIIIICLCCIHITRA